MKPAFLKLNSFCLIIGILLFFAPVIRGATLNWTNNGTGDFGTAANWSPNAVPGGADWARVTNGGTILVADGSTYTVSNLWVGARNFINATGTVRITSGTLSVAGQGSAANRPQIGIGANAFGKIEVDGGTFDRPNLNPIYFGGSGGIGLLNLSSGNVFIDQLRAGSDNDNATGGGTGYVTVSGGLMVVTNQWTVGRDGEIGVVNITGGAVINHALNNYLGTATDDFLTIAGGNGSTGMVTVATGAILRAEGGIRTGQAADAGKSADGTLRLTGGRLVTQRIFQGATTGISTPKVEFDGGVLEAFMPTNANGFMYGGLIVKVKAGGIAIDSAGYDLRVYPGFLEDVTSPGGGIVKSNSGTLQLLGANTYKGNTIIEGGLVVLTTASSGGGGLTANNGSGFATMISSAGSSLNLSSLTLNAGAGTNHLSLDLGAFGNPTAAVIIATNLTVNRTNQLTISGGGLSVGQFPLIAYTTGSGVTADHFELVSLPAGVSAQLVFDPNMIKLNITAAPSLHWNGNLSSDWDTNTANWLDVSGPTPTAAVYNDGSAVQFDDAAFTNYVNLVQALLPVLVTVTNQSVNYTFAGTGYVSGAASLRKQGSATLTLATPNNYSGGTTISAGTLQLGATEAIPHGAARGGLVVTGTLDLNGFGETVNGLSGSGLIDNSSGAPCTLTAGNSSGTGTFTGIITNSGSGPLTFAKAGNSVITLSGPLRQSGGVSVSGGTLVITGNNFYSGGTTISSGTLRVASDAALGSGPISMTANGVTLTPDGSAPRVVTNDLVLSANVTFGSIGAGTMTNAGNVDFGGANRNLTFDSDVVWAGATLGNGTVDDKLGAATLTLLNIVGDMATSSATEIRNGAVILDGAQITKSAEAMRVMSEVSGGTARLLITNNGSLTIIASGSNLRIGYDNATGLTSTNIVNVYGSVHVLGTGTGGQIQLGSICQRAVLNAWSGSLLEIKGITHVSNSSAPNAFSEVNLDGTTLRATLDTTSFMEGLSNVLVHTGGVTVDTTNYTITVAQNLLAGTGNGGLRKIGAGTLFLNGTNTYAGSTIVSNGALGGSGTLAGPLLITTGGVLMPGTSLGTLTVSNTLTLQGTAIMELSRDSGAAESDLVTGVSTLLLNGSLVVTNSGSSPLKSGDVFNLFDAVTITGGFISVSLPALQPGLSWNTNNLATAGTIAVTGTATPLQFNAPVLSGSDLVLSGTGGQPGGGYSVLTSTNAALPLIDWTLVTNKMFDSSGNFDFTDAVNPAAAQRFYLISVP